MRWDTANLHCTLTLNMASLQYNSPCQHCWSVQLTLSALLVSTTHLVSTAGQYNSPCQHCWSVQLTLSALLVSTRWPAFITHTHLVSTGCQYNSPCQHCWSVQDGQSSLHTHLVSTAGQYKMITLPDNAAGQYNGAEDSPPSAHSP